MRKNIYIIGLLVIMVVILSVSGCTTASQPGVIGSAGHSTGLWVTGEGKVNAVPDIAVLNLGVEAEADTVAGAQSQASNAMDAVMQALRDNGIQENDITTQYFSIYPVRNYVPDTGEQNLVGYRVSNTVTVKIRTVSDAGSIIDDAVAAGGNNIIVNNISFTLEDPTAARNEARMKALDDAKAKAQAIADKEGLELGEPAFISEVSGSNTYRTELMMAPAPAVDMGTSISPGETAITVYMQVAYDIN